MLSAIIFCGPAQSPFGGEVPLPAETEMRYSLRAPADAVSTVETKGRGYVLRFSQGGVETLRQEVGPSGGRAAREIQKQGKAAFFTSWPGRFGTAEIAVGTDGTLTLSHRSNVKRGPMAGMGCDVIDSTKRLAETASTLLGLFVERWMALPLPERDRNRVPLFPPTEPYGVRLAEGYRHETVGKGEDLMLRFLKSDGPTVEVYAPSRRIRFGVLGATGPEWQVGLQRGLSLGVSVRGDKDSLTVMGWRPLMHAPTPVGPLVRVLETSPRGLVTAVMAFFSHELMLH